MKFLNIIGLFFVAIGVAYLVWESQGSYLNKQSSTFEQLYPSDTLGTEEIQPIPRHVNINPSLVSLGKKLFMDQRLSERGFSCVSCHLIDQDATDNRKVSIDIRGGSDVMNTPTLFNVGLNPLLNWFGRQITLEQQIDAVLANEKHMGGDWDKILKRLRNDEEYTDKFAEIFSDGITRNNIKFAIANFERTLLTPDSPFDKYLRGDVEAITLKQKNGFKLFKQYGCIACHQGINVGGNLHARLGTFKSPFKQKTPDATKNKYNLGRYNITGDENDIHVFRVPSLRNVARTAPYFHGGKIKELDKAVKFMGKYQIGREISDHDVQLITEFLHSLTGEYEGRPI